MKTKFLLVPALLATLALSACTPPEPTVFGVPQSQWAQLTPAQKQEAIKGYNEQQKINAENAPIESAIAGATSVVRQKQNNDAWHQQSSMQGPSIPSAPPMPTPHTY